MMAEGLLQLGSGLLGVIVHDSNVGTFGHSVSIIRNLLCYIRKCTGFYVNTSKPGTQTCYLL